MYSLIGSTVASRSPGPSLCRVFLLQILNLKNILANILHHSVTRPSVSQQNFIKTLSTHAQEGYS